MILKLMIYLIYLCYVYSKETINNTLTNNTVNYDQIDITTINNQTRTERQYWLKLKNNNNRVIFGNSVSNINNSNFCRTPDNQIGQCTDVRNCIWLVFDLTKFRQSVCFKSIFLPGVCCPIRSNSNNHFEEHTNKFVSSSNFLKPINNNTALDNQINFNRPSPPIFKPQTTTTNKPFHLTESSNHIDLVTESTTKNSLLFFTTQSIFSPFKDYYTTDKKLFFFKDTKYTTPATNLNEIIETNLTSNHINYLTPNIDKMLQECGISGRDARIVGGSDTQPGQWPWMAAIFLHRPHRLPEFWCGGALISNEYVLTAAHCLSDPRGHSFSPSHFTIRLGAHDITRIVNNVTDSSTSNLTGTEFKVSKLIPHPKFVRQGYYNDIGLMKIANSPIELNDLIHPICLPTEEDTKRDLKGQVATVLGFGTLYYGGPSSKSLQQVELPIWSNEQCDKRYFQPINDGFLCAGFLSGGKDACQGDSGSPLALADNRRWTIYGVVSFGNKCAQVNYPGVYTRISKYLTWVKQSIKNNDHNMI